MSPFLFNLYAERIPVVRKANMEEAKEGVKIEGRILNNLRYADDTSLMAGKESGSDKTDKKVEERKRKGRPIFQHKIVIVNSKLLKRHSKAKRTAPANSRALRQIRGVFQ